MPRRRRRKNARHQRFLAELKAIEGQEAKREFALKRLTEACEELLQRWEGSRPKEKKSS